MVSAKHTLGPWFVEVTDKSGIACIRGTMTGDRCRSSDGTGEVANVDLMADGEQDTVMFPRQRADMLANAHLIAAVLIFWKRLGALSECSPATWTVTGRLAIRSKCSAPPSSKPKVSSLLRGATVAEFKAKSAAEMRKLAEAATPGNRTTNGSAWDAGWSVDYDGSSSSIAVWIEGNADPFGFVVAPEAYGAAADQLRSDADFLLAANPSQLTAMCDLIEAQARRIEEVDKIVPGLADNLIGLARALQVNGYPDTGKALQATAEALRALLTTGAEG